MKKIFFIASRFPFPAYGGREKTLLEYLDYIKDDYIVYFFYFEKEEISCKVLKEFQIKYNFGKIYFLKIPNFFKSILNVFIQSFIFNRKSIQESVFWDRNILNFMSKQIEKIKPDVIFADMIRTAQYFEKTDTYKIFDMDDMISKRYKYFLNHKDIDILGNFAGKLPLFVVSIINSILRSLILKKEAFLVGKREIELTQIFDKTLLVSPSESAELQKRVSHPLEKVFSIFPSVDCKKDESDVIKKIPRSICFMGLLNVPHNEKGLIYFIKNLLPKLLKKTPDLKFYIIGKNATTQLVNLTEKYENIILTGFVENPKKLILSTQILVAPLYFGTGIKIKILESMSYGIPIITTPIGVEGLKVENKKNILVATTDQLFIEYILEVFHNSTLAKELGENAKNYVNTFHNKKDLGQQFINLLKGKEDE